MARRDYTDDKRLAKKKEKSETKLEARKNDQFQVYLNINSPTAAPMKKNDYEN